MYKKGRGFTLVELLSVIVILAIILVIAVPSITSTITEARKGALASSAKLIASSAETMKLSNQTLGIDREIACYDVANYTSEDYQSCYIDFVDGNAVVSIIGKGKFEGMRVCSGTKENAESIVEDSCPFFENDSWETIIAAVRAGNTSKYVVGDTKKVTLTGLGEHTLRIANKSNDWEHCGEDGYSETACGFALEFADIITTHNMNPTGTYNETQYDYGWNKDGWPGSQMYDYINATEETGSGTIYNALVSAIGDIIIDTTVVSSLGSEDKNRAEGNFVSTDKVYLLSPEEVYGTSFTNGYDTSRGTSRQLDYYATYENADGTTGVTTSKYAGAIKQNSGSNAYWWLRSAWSYDTYDFYDVSSHGYLDGNSAYGARGISPAFRLG